jgi:branched-chain amino acid aminotransferase
LRRAAYFNDQAVESMRMSDGEIPLLSLHLDRLYGSMQKMGMSVPETWKEDFWLSQIRRTSREQHLRIRLMVFRKEGLLYLPEGGEVGWLMECAPLPGPLFEWQAAGLQIGKVEGVRLPVDQFSGIKSMNAARYVAAAREVEEKGWSEGILLNTSGRVCETVYSNIFWFEQQDLFAIPRSEGGVDGVFRRFLMTYSHSSGFPIREKVATFAELMEADEIFLTNAIRGIQWVEKIGRKTFPAVRTFALHQKLMPI